MARRVPVALALIVALGLLAAACGGSGTPTVQTYTAKATAPCLKQAKGFHGVTTNPLEVGLIAAAAEHGGLRATTSDRNVLTIAFARDESAAADTQKAFTLHAPKKLRPHITDIMESKANAVLVWTVTPKQAQLDTVLNCLSS